MFGQYLHFPLGAKQLIGRIVNILLDIVKYKEDMQQEDSHVQIGQSK